MRDRGLECAEARRGRQGLPLIAWPVFRVAATALCSGKAFYTGLKVASER